MRTPARLSLLAGALTAGAGIGSLVAASVLSGPRRPDFNYGFSPFELQVPSEDIRFTAADGTALAGWWLDRPGSDRVVICCHGHRGTKADLLGLASGLWRAGMTVLMFDFRGNGASGDGPQSLAHYEQQDLEAAISYVAHRRPDARIGVAGYSMGAAVALLVSARDPRVERVLADSPFADMSGVVANAAREMRLPPFPLTTLVDQATRLRYGYRFREVEPITVVADIAPRPLLLFHGTADTTIPVDHSQRLAAAAGPTCELHIVPGAGHCGAYFTDRAGYLATATRFFTRPEA